MDPERFVFLDETGAAINMVRRYGWAPRSERLITAAPHGHWRTTTFVAGLRSTGLLSPLVLDGPMTGTAFLAYVEQFLAPKLRRGDIVVIDNLGAHKVTGVAKATRAVGAGVLYLSPYSPDLNPVENVWQFLRQNHLSNRVFDTYTAIVDACCDAWNALMAQPERIQSITTRSWM